MHKEVFRYDAGSLNPANGFFPNGLHEVTVCFDLPDHCPSSMLFNNHISREKPLVAITYQVSCKMITSEMTDAEDSSDCEVTPWGCDKMFMVRESAVVV